MKDGMDLTDEYQKTLAGDEDTPYEEEDMSDLDQEFDNVGKGTEEVSISDLDSALKSVRELELDYSQKKKISNKADALAKEAKANFIGLLEASGRTRWDAPEGADFSGFSLSYSLKFRVPQGPNDSELFGDFLKSEKVAELLGQDSRDIFLKYFKVSSQSLGPLCKQLKELAAENGEDLEIPGLLQPTSEAKLTSVSKKK